MKESIFRKVALERLSSPEQLDQLMTVTTSKGWFALIVLGFLLLTGLSWGIFGRIPIKMTGTGIVIKRGGLNNVVALDTGQISEVFVEPGDVVGKGQVVGTLSIEIRRPEGNNQQKQLPTYMGRITSKLALSSKVIRAISIDIISPFSGRVLEVLVEKGELADIGTPLISLEPVDRKLEIVVYMPSAEGKKATAGMEIQIVPSTVNREEYGFIKGKVRSVSEFPTSSQSMLSTLKNEELVKMFSQQGSTIEIVAEMILDAKTFSGYLWSSGKGPESHLYSGTLCEASVVTEKQRPLSLMFLWLRKLIGQEGKKQ